MNKYLSLFAMGLGCSLLTASAEEYPLQFKPIPPQEVMDFPGGYGSYSQIKLKKPKELKKEPAAKSPKPLYGQLGQSDSSGLIYRLDESKGKGKGYDQLILDINQNGDLTDDPVIDIAKLEKDGPGKQIIPNQPFFGPITLPESQSVAGGRPAYYAQAYIFISNLDKLSEQQQENMYLGQLRMRAAWYLEAKVKFGNKEQKFGIIDANANLKLGDLPTPMSYNNGDESVKNWTFLPGDMFLSDMDGSGAFERNAFDLETAPFHSLFYVGATPYKVTPAKDFSKIQVEPWNDPLVEVALQPNGDQVSRVQLALETKPDKWELFEAGASQGKIRVPPGNYRLYSCVLIATNSNKAIFATEGYLRTQRKPMTFTADAANTLKCGAPLDIKVTATKRNPQPYEESQLESKTEKDSDSILTINSTVVGQGGEVYSTYTQGKNFRPLSQKPTVAIAESNGKSLKNGNMEFG